MNELSSTALDTVKQDNNPNTTKNDQSLNPNLLVKMAKTDFIGN